MNLKCNGSFGGLPNAFPLGTPDAPFFQGTTPALTVTVTLPDGVTPVNLMGAKVYLTCKSDPSDADPGLFQLSTVTGEIVLAAQSGTTVGQLTATFPAVATASLSAMRSYPYDVRIILAGNVQTVLYGLLTLSQAITQSES